MLPQEVPRTFTARSSTRSPGVSAPGRNCWPSIITWPAGWPREGSDDLQAGLDRIQHALEVDGGWRMHQEVEAVVSRMTPRSRTPTWPPFPPA